MEVLLCCKVVESGYFALRLGRWLDFFVEMLYSKTQIGSIC